MKRFCIVITGLMLMLPSCKKDTRSSQLPNGFVGDTTRYFLKYVQSDTLSNYYISGEFDGYKIYTASTFANIFPYHDTTFNAFYTSNTLDLDNIHLIRVNHDKSVQIAIYFDKARIFTRQFPYILPHGNTTIGEKAEVSLINLKEVNNAGINSLNDYFSFWGNTNSSIKLEVNSFVNNIMEGTFEGTLRANSGTSIIVKNGRFRLKIITVFR